MPRTRLDKYSKPQLPEVDILKGFILERMNLHDHRVTAEQLAARTSMSTANMRKLLNKNTEEWSADQRKAVCSVLGLDEKRVRALDYFYDNLLNFSPK